METVFYIFIGILFLWFLVGVVCPLVGGIIKELKNEKL